MAKVTFSKDIVKHIIRTFSVSEANQVLDFLESLETTPKKGKALAHVGSVVIKEVRYKKFRFYFITDGHILKFGTEDELASLLIRFVRMSDKNDQQKVIDQIKDVLRSFGFDRF